MDEQINSAQTTKDTTVQTTEINKQETQTPDKVDYAEYAKLQESHKKLNDERTILGRKVKMLEENGQRLSSQIDTLISKIDSNITQPNIAQIENTEIDITDVQSVSKFIDQKVEQRIKAEKTKEELSKTNYENSYISQLQILGNQESDIGVYNQILDEMKNFNTRYSDNAKADAEINYLKAKTSVLSGGTKQGNVSRETLQAQTKTNPFLGTGSKVAAGVGGGSQTTYTNAPEVKLTEMARNYLMRIGKLNDAEFIKKALQ